MRVDIRMSRTTWNSPRYNANANTIVIDQWTARVAAACAEAICSECAQLVRMDQRLKSHWGETLTAFTKADGSSFFELQEWGDVVVVDIGITS